MRSLFRHQLGKLPDKGKRIQDLLDRAVAALEMKTEVEAASRLLASINLGKDDVENIEWKDKSKPSEALDSDDDEDPLAILTSSNSVNKNQRIVKEDEVEHPLIAAKDIEEIANVRLSLDPVLEHVCKNENLEKPKRFLLNKPKPPSTTSSTSSLDSLKENKKVRDNTAATPPDVGSQGVKMLPLREAIELENQQRKHMKNLLEEQAAARLALKEKELEHTRASDSEFPIKQVASNMSKYRLASSFLEEDDDQDQNSMSEGEDDWGDQ